MVSNKDRDDKSDIDEAFQKRGQKTVKGTPSPEKGQDQPPPPPPTDED